MLTGQPGCQETPFIRVRIAALSPVMLDRKTGAGSVVGEGAGVAGDGVVPRGAVAVWTGEGAAEVAGGDEVAEVGADAGPAAQPAAIRIAVKLDSTATVTAGTRFTGSSARAYRG
jgi:hypothetical protein